MTVAEANEKIERQLQEAIDHLRADLVRVEIWASALTGFSRPIPDYQPADDMTRHLLPSRCDEGKSAARREPGSAPKHRDRLGEH